MRRLQSPLGFQVKPDQIVEHEREGARTAVIAAFAAAGLLIAGTFVGFGSAAATNGDGELLREVADGKVIRLIAVTLQSLGFIALILPLRYLFDAALARSDRMNRAFRAMVVIGPALLAVAGVAVSLSLASAADEFIDEAPPQTREGRAVLDETVEQALSDPDSIEEMRLYPVEEQAADGDADAGSADTEVEGPTTEPAPEPGSGVLEVEQADEEIYLIPVSAERLDEVEEQLEASDVRFSVDDEGTPGDLLAGFIRRDRTIGSQLLLAAGGFSTLFAIFYTALHAMRVGLLTKFWGTLGMALAFLLIVIPASAVPGLALFSGYLGRLFGDNLNGPRPPAWDTGESIPWDSARDAPQDGSESDEVGLPDGYGDGDSEELPADAADLDPSRTQESPSGQAPGRAKRKRKRR